MTSSRIHLLAAIVIAALVAPVLAAQGSTAPTTFQADAMWSNFDYQAGEEVLFYEDFTADRVGNFPQRLEFENGAMQVVDWNGRRWVAMEAPESTFAVPLPAPLPERFTIEFDFVEGAGRQRVRYGLGITTEKPRTTGSWEHYLKTSYLSVAHRLGTGIRTKDSLGPSSTGSDERLFSGPVRIRIQVDGEYAKLYVEENRIGNLPRALLERGDRLYFIGAATEEEPLLITDLTIAAGGSDLYDALANRESVIARGILFETSSAQLLPESTAVLAEVADVLAREPDWVLAVDGHTDSTGDAAYNRELSEARARAVCDYLAQVHGIAGDRLVPSGHGADRPIGDNATVQGRRANRRVELSLAG